MDFRIASTAITLAFILFGCSHEPEVIVVTATPPPPTETIEPTPSPTNTLRPTRTPRPTKGPCDVEDVEEYVDDVLSFWTSFDDLYDEILNSPGDYLPVIELLTLSLHFYNDTPHPQCASEYHADLSGAAVAVAGGFNEMYLDPADERFDEIIEEIQSNYPLIEVHVQTIYNLSLCAPNCP